METLCVLSLLGMLLWEESGCKAMTLNSVLLRQVSGRHVLSLQRRRRNWVWNQFFVLEEFTGDKPLYVGKLHSDVDRSDGQVKYVLSGDGAKSVFSIDENTGDIHATQRLDREQQAYYTLRAQARDTNTNLALEPESQFVIKVQDINDNEPRFLDGPYTSRVAEMSPVGTSVITVSASDADDPTYGNSARLVYSIVQGQPYFSVEPKTGVVRTTLPDMDRELRDRYLLVVQAKDMIGQIGGLSGTTSVTVMLTDVNDNPPRFPHESYQLSVPESAPAFSVLTKIRALDPDVGPNAEIDYKILDGDDLGTFRILTDPNTQEGIIVLHKTLDFETRSSYTLRIQASNRYVEPRFLSMGPFTDLTTVLLRVENTDEAPVFSSSVSHMKISESAQVGTDVGSVSAQDPDGSLIRYSIDRGTDLDHHFTIDMSSGVIRTNHPLDRETVALHNLSVLATEMEGSQVGTAVVLVSVTDVNDNAPILASEDQTFVCENTLAGKIIETLSAVDRDDPENGHHFRFSLAETADNINFTLRDNNDNTASVLTRRFLHNHHLMHFLPVVVSDIGSPSLSSTNTLTVKVCSCDGDGRRRSCGRGRSQMLVFALSFTVSVLTLLGFVAVTVAFKRRKLEPLMTNQEQDVGENIVRYDDEGGGEEDTEAFDMVALRHLNQTKKNPALRPHGSEASNTTRDKKQLLQEFIGDRLQETDLDPMAPPYDSLQTFAFEGSGSDAESLSSLDSFNSSNVLKCSSQNMPGIRI